MRIIFAVFFFLGNCPIAMGQLSPGKNEVELILKGISGEPDWNTINRELVSRLGEEKGDSILLTARLHYYWEIKQYPRYVKEYIRFVQKNNLLGTPGRKNAAAWRVFQYASDTADLNLAGRWAFDAIETEPANNYYHDTYANILYKTGKVKEAIEWETPAVWGQHLHASLLSNFFKMQTGLPTWIYPESLPVLVDSKRQAAVWTNMEKGYKRKVDAAIWRAKIEVYKSIHDSISYVQTITEFVEVSKITSAEQLNRYAWEVFIFGSTKAKLKKALGWSDKSLENGASNPEFYNFMETNANLLYKLGRRKAAITMQEKAAEACPEDKKMDFQVTLNKMKKGEKI